MDMYQMVLGFLLQKAHCCQGMQEDARAEQHDDQPVAGRALLRDLKRATQRLGDLVDQLTCHEIAPIGWPVLGEAQIERDRLRTIVDSVAYLHERTEPARESLPERENAIGAESPEVIATAVEIGERRLRRLNPAHAVTALIGAFGVSFGAIAMSWVAGPWVATLGFERAQLIGAVAFPIGFVIVLVGKGELFTENFFVPVTGVIRGRGTIRELLELWGYVLFFNIVGSVVAAFLMSRAGVLDGHAATFLKHLANTKVNDPFWSAFMKAIFAGWLMTIMTWLILAATGLGPGIAIIWMIGFLIVAAHFNHVVISAPEIFAAMFLGAPISIGNSFIGNFIPALLGSLIGGVVFVTLLGITQASMLEQGEEANESNNRDRLGRHQ